MKPTINDELKTCASGAIIKHNNHSLKLNSVY